MQEILYARSGNGNADAVDVGDDCEQAQQYTDSVPVFH